MPLDNTEYIYNSLPGRFRRDDQALMLKRFLSHFGEKYDTFDAAYDAFHASITAGTASSEYVTFWLEVLFGWSWFPAWFKLADKRRLYGNFGRHLARRGTAGGIVAFLKEFGIVARVHRRPAAYGEFAYGESRFSIDRPLHMVIEILRIKQPPMDASFLGEAPYGEMFYSNPTRPLTDRDLINLVKFQQPNAQVIDIYWTVKRFVRVNLTPTWQQLGWDADIVFGSVEW